MITLAKLIAAGALGLAILYPAFGPRVDTCECKTKSAVQPMTPHVDTCECKAKTPT